MLAPPATYCSVNHDLWRMSFWTLKMTSKVSGVKNIRAMDLIAKKKGRKETCPNSSTTTC